MSYNIKQNTDEENKKLESSEQKDKLVNLTDKLVNEDQPKQEITEEKKEAIVLSDMLKDDNPNQDDKKDGIIVDSSKETLVEKMEEEKSKAQVTTNDASKEPIKSSENNMQKPQEINDKKDSEVPIVPKVPEYNNNKKENAVPKVPENNPKKENKKITDKKNNNHNNTINAKNTNNINNRWKPKIEPKNNSVKKDKPTQGLSQKNTIAKNHNTIEKGSYCSVPKSAKTKKRTAETIDYESPSYLDMTIESHPRRRFPSSYHQAYSSNSSQISTTGILYNQIKDLNISTREIRDYFKKMEAIKKKLRALEKQKEDIKKRKEYYEKKEKQCAQCKKDKEELRLALSDMNKENTNKIKNKHDKIKNANKIFKDQSVKKKTDIKTIKKNNYTKFMCEKKNVENYCKDLKVKTKIENEEKFKKDKEYKAQYADKRRKYLEQQEEESRQYYEKIAEEKKKLAEKFKKELEDLEKIEKEQMKTIKESQKENEELSKMSVNKNNFFSTIDSSKTVGSKIKKERSTSVTNSNNVSNKPFIVKSVGCNDSFYNYHSKSSKVNQTPTKDANKK